jgi:transposase
MSLPAFSTQAELFSTAGLSASLFAQDDRYRLFARLIYPALATARTTLANCYCQDNGRVALEPVLMLGVSLLQELDGVPDRQAAEMLRYHAGWNFALNRQLGDEVFHPSSLANFRQRLAEHDQSALGFTTILEALEKAGLISRQSRQRLDSTQMFGRVARMSRLDCVRESLRLALQELEPLVQPQARPLFWLALWERYVDSQVDYRAGSETLARKLGEAGTDSWQLLQWLGQPEQALWSRGAQAQLLRRVFGEQFEIRAGQPTPAALAKVAVEQGEPSAIPNAAAPQQSEADGVEVADAAKDGPAPIKEPELFVTAAQEQESPSEKEPAAAAPVAVIQPKDKKELASNRVQNPHEPQATYAAKGQGDKKKEHVGYKVQVAETVSEVSLAPGEPTHNFIVGIVTHAAFESDETGAAKMEAEQAAMGLGKPPVQYVDGAYVSAQELARAAAEGRELIGPAPPVADNNEGRFTTEQFQIHVEQRQAVCPAGKPNTQCSRLEEKQTDRVSFRFEWSTHCADCPLRRQCVAPKQKHRMIVVGEHHSALQTRRQEQQTDAFKQRMRHRNGIEGTQSELVRGHGLRRARYRGLNKARLQNYFIGAACNVKRWLRGEAWKLQQSLRALAQAAAPVTMS